MTRAKIVGGAFATVLILLALVAAYRAFEQRVDPAGTNSPTITPAGAAACSYAACAASPWRTRWQGT